MNKYKHKLSPWITTEVIKFVGFHDKSYKRFRMILNIPGNHFQKIRRISKSRYQNNKKEYYTREFIKYTNNTRKTWDTLKDIINNKTSKSKLLIICYVARNIFYVTVDYKLSEPLWMLRSNILLSATWVISPTYLVIISCARLSIRCTADEISCLGVNKS